jgi:hypothetical protein
MTVEGNVAAVWCGQPQTKAQSCGFAGAIGAEQAEAGAGFDCKRQAGNHCAAGVGLAELADA